MSEVRRTCVSGQCWAAAALGAADQVRLRVCCMCVCVFVVGLEGIVRVLCIVVCG